MKMLLTMMPKKKNHDAQQRPVKMGFFWNFIEVEVHVVVAFGGCLRNLLIIQPPGQPIPTTFHCILG